MGRRVGVVGAAGRMGATVCAAVEADPELDLVAAIDIDDRLDALADAGAEVAVDFTIAPAARETLPWLAGRGIHAVVGTTGLSEDDLKATAAAFEAAGRECLLAPNFAIGAVLMMRFAELAAPFFETAEVIELHHDAKRDAPSGTALRTVERMAAASAEWAADPTEDEVVPGARGGAGPGGIHVHAVRLRGVVAHQEVILGTTGQTLSIRHDSYDRSSFMPGVVLACKKVGGRRGLTIGLDALLDL